MKTARAVLAYAQEVVYSILGIAFILALFLLTAVSIITGVYLIFRR